MRHDGQDVPVLAARAGSGEAKSWRRGAGGYTRRARSMRTGWNILAAVSVQTCAEEPC